MRSSKLSIYSADVYPQLIKNPEKNKNSFSLQILSVKIMETQKLPAL